MGIRDVFTSSANLPGIARVKTGSPLELYVTKVVQKSGLEVNEQGTTAFSATGTSIDRRFRFAISRTRTCINDVSFAGVMLDDRVGLRTEMFLATHPFLFFIEDRDTGSVVFVGKVVEPQTSDATPPKASGSGNATSLQTP